MDKSTALVALIGRPNVGKSTLFNRMTRSRDALVDPTPGVTRDRHYARVRLEERSFLLVDTGGIAEPGDPMADSIREQALQAMEEADVILFLMDGREGLNPADEEIAALLRRSDGEKKVFHVVNKIDGPEQEALLLPAFYALGVDRLWSLSAEHRFGFQQLMDDLAAALPSRSEADDLPENTIRMAFFGRPNVGKSSMVNRILGSERMVVSEVAGTTRDSVDSLQSRDQWNYLLIDTAGIRRKGRTSDKLEKFSILKALAALNRCDVALVLIDAGEGITLQDLNVIGYTQDQGRALVVLVNKWDLLKDDPERRKQLEEEIEQALNFIPFAPVLKVSALTGAGIKRIFPMVGSVHRQFHQRFPTSGLNRLLADAVAHHPPAMFQGRRLKFYYTVQIGAAPPSFVVFTNAPKGVHFSYERYLVNRFREGLGLDRVPVRIFFRERSGREKKK